MGTSDPQENRNSNESRAKEAYGYAKQRATGFWRIAKRGWSGIVARTNTDRIIATSTVVIMIATIGGAVSTYLQWTELKSSSEQVERSIKASNRIADESKAANVLTGEANRPWIGAVAVTVVPSIFEGKEAVTTITLSNSGKSPAYVVQARCGTSVLPASPTDPPYVLSVIQSQIGSKNIVVPGQQFGCPFRSRAIPSSELARVKLSAGQYSFYVYGEILYRDVATKSEHTTHVCWVYNASVDAYVFCATYNSAN